MPPTGYNSRTNTLRIQAAQHQKSWPPIKKSLVGKLRRLALNHECLKASGREVYKSNITATALNFNKPRNQTAVAENTRHRKSNFLHQNIILTGLIFVTNTPRNQTVHAESTGHTYKNNLRYQKTSK